MKPRKTPVTRKTGGGTLIGLFVGLVIGMVVVAGVVWYVNKAPLPFTTNGQQPKASPPVAASKPPAQPAAQATPEATPPAGPAPLPLPGKPGEPSASEKTRFDFYKILPGKAEAIPDPKPEEPKSTDAAQGETKPPAAKPTDGKSGEPKPAEAKAGETKPSEPKVAVAKPAEKKPSDSKPAEIKSKPEKDTTLKEPIYLQAGSFQSAGEADNQKARLALIGAEARIQQVMLQDKVWYRVRIGPYHKMDDVTHMRADLAKQGIDANVVKKD
ncbi:MAG TPA: SPOR domain-containing protein [Accumulibacter sp.]|jgi:cell division protein FtsN|nr:SPOR domain-containing protein [Accumulibacter sp.]HQC80864.1 SPOR domain-containing protein [Accumulibacter sp.]